MEVNAKLVRQNSDAIPVFVYAHADFPEKKLYFPKRYIHVTQKGIEKSLFFLSEDSVPATGARGIGALSVGRNNRTDGAKANNTSNLLFVRTSSLSLEDTTEFCRQGIDIDDDNDPALENSPRKGETTPGTVNRKREVIICPRKSGTFKIISLLSDIICKTLSFVCH